MENPGEDQWELPHTFFHKNKEKKSGPTDEIAHGVPQRSSSPASPPGLVVFHVGLQLGLQALPLLPLQTPALLLLLDLQHGTTPLRNTTKGSVTHFFRLPRVSRRI